MKLSGRNRKHIVCPLCGRLEVVAQENELVACGRCALLRAEAWAKKNTMPSGKDLLKARETQKITIKHLAHELGITQEYLCMMENGKRPINKQTYEWISQQKTETRAL